MKFGARPTSDPYFRSSREQKRWKVLIQTGSPGASCSTRERISSAALLVNVSETIPRAGTPWRSRLAMRWVITRVLPLPGPASTNSGPSRCSTASRWAGVNELSDSLHKGQGSSRASKFE